MTVLLSHRKIRQLWNNISQKQWLLNPKKKKCCVGKEKKSCTWHGSAKNNVYSSKLCKHWLVTKVQFSGQIWGGWRDEVCVYIWGGSGQRQLNLHLPLWKTDRLCLKVDYPGTAMKAHFQNTWFKRISQKSWNWLLL